MWFVLYVPQQIKMYMITMAVLAAKNRMYNDDFNAQILEFVWFIHSI